MNAAREGTSTWRDVLAIDDVLGGRAASAAKPGPRCSWAMVAAHCLDLMTLIFLGAVAALFRFGEIYLIRPQLQGLGGLCNETAYRLPYKEATVEVPSFALYICVILAPIVLIALLEIVLVFALQRQINRIPSVRSAKIFFFKRCAKMLLVFLLGLSLASVLADLIRMFVSRPRPYFLADDSRGSYARYCEPGNFEDHVMSPDEYEARLSFPSHRCTVLAYSGAVVAMHAELVLRRVRAGGMYALRALLLLAATLPALLVTSQILESRSNHWSDVVVGLLLGALLAVYAVLVLGRDMEAEVHTVASTPLSDGHRRASLPRLRVGHGQRAPLPPGPPSAVPSVEAINTMQPYQRLSAPHKMNDAFY